MNQIENSNVQIIQLLDEWVRSVQEKNLDGSINKHADDVVMPLQSNGLAAYAQTWELFFSNNKGGNESFDLGEIEELPVIR